MFNEEAEGPAREVLARFAALVSELVEFDRGGLPATELLELVRDLEVQTRRLAAVDQANLAEMEARHLASELKVRDTKTLLIDLLRIDPGEAKRRTDAARDLGPRTSLLGEPLPPVFPQLAVAVAGGRVSMEHVRHVVEFVEKLPAEVERELSDQLQAHLLDTAAHTYPRNLGTLAAALLARVDQDGVEPREEVNQRRRSFGLYTDSHGWSRAYGYLSPRLTAVVKAVLDPLAAPQPDEDGSPDERSADQRRHDGLCTGLERLLRSGDLPDAGGAPVTVLVTVTESELRERVGHAVTAHGDLLPIKELVRMAGDAEVIPVFLSDTGGVMAHGRSKRLATPGQRRALAARDGGCSRPGCSAPPGWCESHHIVPWVDGGSTDVANMALVCPHHHRQLDRGWDVVMIRGVPHWRAPAWIDPSRNPRRNAAHHSPIRFAATQETRHEVRVEGDFLPCGGGLDAHTLEGG